jgi:hypothetical protein
VATPWGVESGDMSELELVDGTGDVYSRICKLLEKP